MSVCIIAMNKMLHCLPFSSYCYFHLLFFFCLGLCLFLPFYSSIGSASAHLLPHPRSFVPLLLWAFLLPAVCKAWGSRSFAVWCVQMRCWVIITNHMKLKNPTKNTEHTSNTPKVLVAINCFNWLIQTKYGKANNKQQLGTNKKYSQIISSNFFHSFASSQLNCSFY